MGRLTRDVEQKFLANEMCIANFSLAVDGRKKDDPANFIDCTAFGKTAELIGQYFSKGKPILVNGSLKQETWEDKNTGAKRSKIGVTVENFSFLPKNSDSSEPGVSQSEAAVVWRDGRDQNYNAAPLPAGNDVDEPPFR